MFKKIKLFNFRKNIGKSFTIIAFCALLNACKNDLEVNAPHKETIVVFGLLDPSQSKQYIKVNRAFITNNQSVKEVAQIADSVYFSSIEVTLLEELTNTTTILTPENIPNKNSGIFLNQPNILYTTNLPIKTNSRYFIKVKDNKTGIEANAVAIIAGSPFINGPITNFSTDFSLSNGPNGGINIDFVPGINTANYDVIMDFEYVEYDKFDTLNKFNKTITWKILKNVSPKATFRFSNNISRELFYDLLTSQIAPRKDWIRQAKSFQFSFIGATQELVNYISVSTPSIGIVQKQTDYTNINNGAGIFASRNIFLTKKVPPSGQTSFLLSNSPKTSAIGF